MTPFAFDTLSASKRLREAGMAEGVAEAVVAVFQHATASVDFGQLATKADLELHRAGTKADLDQYSSATKSGFESLMHSTRADLDSVMAQVRLEIRELELRLQRRSNLHTWGIIGLLTGVITVVTAISTMFR
ncbi:MAG: hypothetical protein Q8L23_12615 [Caulobacter sp.]|nr:hypothetical protein [Caulobacter sp.]